MSTCTSVKEQVVETSATLLERGYLKANEGNVSFRLPDSNEFAITPSGYDYSRLTAGDVCVLDLDLHQTDGTLKPSIESGLHAAAYRYRRDVNVVVHTHPPYTSALAILRKPIPALFDEQVRYLGREVPIVRYAPSGTAPLRMAVTAKIHAGGNAFILANHGVLVLGTDLEQALHNLALLEKCSTSYLMSLMTGERTRRNPLAVREIAFHQLRSEERRAAAGTSAAVLAGDSGNGPGLAAPGVLPEAPPAAAVADPGALRATPERPRRTEPPTGADLAISEYPDVADVYARLEALVSQPLARIGREAMADYLDYFDGKCHRSRELTDAAKRCIPGGVQHNLAFNHPFPLAVARAEGAYMWDVDGNEYIDFLQAGGPTVLGNNDPAVQRQVIEVLRSSGPVTGLFHPYELELAELVCRLVPSVEMVRMFGSGTESVMAAIRAARAATGKKFVVKVGGAYHGWSDQMVYGMHVPGTRRLEAKGVPWAATSHTCEIYPNSVSGLRRKLIENRAPAARRRSSSNRLGPRAAPGPSPSVSMPRSAISATSSVPS